MRDGRNQEFRSHLAFHALGIHRHRYCTGTCLLDSGHVQRILQPHIDGHLTRIHYLQQLGSRHSMVELHQRTHLLNPRSRPIHDFRPRAHHQGYLLAARGHSPDGVHHGLGELRRIVFSRRREPSSNEYPQLAVQLTLLRRRNIDGLPHVVNPLKHTRSYRRSEQPAYRRFQFLILESGRHNRPVIERTR